MFAVMSDDYNIKYVKIIVYTLMTISAILANFTFLTYETVNLENGSELEIIVFNEQSWNLVDSSAILVGIISASAAIVAIGFSINHLTVTKLFESYASKQFGIYFKKQKIFHVFIILIMIIIGGSILLLFNESIKPPLWSYFFITSLVIGFIFSLGLFFESFYSTFRLINKFDIIDDLKEIIIEKIEKQE